MISHFGALVATVAVVLGVANNSCAQSLQETRGYILDKMRPLLTEGRATDPDVCQIEGKELGGGLGGASRGRHLLQISLEGRHLELLFINRDDFRRIGDICEVRLLSVDLSEIDESKSLSKHWGLFDRDGYFYFALDCMRQGRCISSRTLRYYQILRDGLERKGEYEKVHRLNKFDFFAGEDKRDVDRLRRAFAHYVQLIRQRFQRKELFD